MDLIYMWYKFICGKMSWLLGSCSQSHSLSFDAHLQLSAITFQWNSVLAWSYTHPRCLPLTHIHTPLWQPLHHVVPIVSWSLTRMQIFFLLMNTVHLLGVFIEVRIQYFNGKFFIIFLVLFILCASHRSSGTIAYNWAEGLVLEWKSCTFTIE